MWCSEVYLEHYKKNYTSCPLPYLGRRLCFTLFACTNIFIKQRGFWKTIHKKNYSQISGCPVYSRSFKLTNFFNKTL